MRLGKLARLAGLALLAAVPAAADKVTFGTNWQGRSTSCIAEPTLSGT
ncbi:MAG TPA: hypothetical protein VJY34_13095 [Roseiarcus sp.]|nr:hypothetical protein [Roseiarcus sp.]